MSTNTADEPRHLPGSLRTAQERSERVKLRRGLTFLGMSLVLPGSAQIAAGNRRVGRVAVRIWVGLWILAAFVGLLALVWRSGVVELVTNGATLRVVQVVLIALGLGWATRTTAFLKRHVRAVNLAGGALLVVVGLLMVTGVWSAVVTSLQALIGGYEPAL